MPRYLAILLCRCLALLCLLVSVMPLQAATCTAVPPHTHSTAEQAYLDGDFDLAVKLYSAMLEQRPDDTSSTIGLFHSLIRQQKLKEANTALMGALAAHPQSVALQTALGELQYRRGELWQVGITAGAALKIDPCYGPAHLLAARFLRLNSLYSSAKTEIAVAHNLDPNDPSIRLLWLETLPLKLRATDLEAYLATATGQDKEQRKHLHSYLEYLQKSIVEPHKACRLVSPFETTTIPFAQIMRDATHVQAYGLDVKLNDKTARLQIDTGAGGIVVNRSVANRAGLQRFSKTEVGGIGDQGDRQAYTAFAESIKIGGLEFHDCEVEVVEQRNVVDTDGLIGMDVLSRFLVTLDYPLRKLVLDPLPPLPGDNSPAKPSLETAADKDTADGETDTDEIHSYHDRYIDPTMKDWTRVYRIEHILLVPAYLNNSGKKLFVLDTGAFSTTVAPAVARDVTKVHTGSQYIIKGVSGDIEKVYTADEITFKFANLSQKIQDVIAFDFFNVSKDLDTEISGFIGITALGQTRMTIDYRDGLVNFDYDPKRGFKF